MICYIETVDVDNVCIRHTFYSYEAFSKAYWDFMTDRKYKMVLVP